MKNKLKLILVILSACLLNCDWEQKVPPERGYFAYLHDATYSRVAYTHRDSTCFDWLTGEMPVAERSWTLDLFDVSDTLPDPYRRKLERSGLQPSSWNADYKEQLKTWETRMRQNAQALQEFAAQANHLHVQRKLREDWTYLNRHLHRIWPRLMDPDLEPRILFINSDLIDDEPGRPPATLSVGMIDSLNRAIEAGAHLLIYTEENYQMSPYNELNAHYLGLLDDLEPEMQKIFSPKKIKPL